MEHSLKTTLQKLINFVGKAQSVISVMARVNFKSDLSQLTPTGRLIRITRMSLTSDPDLRGAAIEIPQLQANKLDAPAYQHLGDYPCAERSVRVSRGKEFLIDAKLNNQISSFRELICLKILCKRMRSLSTILLIFRQTPCLGKFEKRAAAGRTQSVSQLLEPSGIARVDLKIMQNSQEEAKSILVIADFVSNYPANRTLPATIVSSYLFWLIFVFRCSYVTERMRAPGPRHNKARHAHGPLSSKQNTRVFRIQLVFQNDKIFDRETQTDVLLVLFESSMT